MLKSTTMTEHRFKSNNIFGCYSIFFISAMLAHNIKQRQAENKE
jgi:hypothetical protein